MAKKGLPTDYFTRSIQTEKIEAKENEGKKRLVGFIPYNKESVSMYGVKEVILPSSFTKSISEANIVALINHDTSKILGSTKNGTLILTNTDEGLQVEVLLPNTTFANDAYEILSRGDIDTMSFGFTPITTDILDSVEYLKEVKLYEISFLVAFPAYEDTTSIALTRNRFKDIVKKRSIDLEALSAVLVKEVLDENDYTYLKNIIAEIQTMIVEDNTKTETEETSDSKEEPKEDRAETKEPDNTTLLESLKALIDLKTEN